MRETDPHLRTLSPQQRQLVESRLVKFDLEWTPTALMDAAKSLAPATDPLRLPILAELVKIDLERRWQSSSPLLLEDYLRQFPELGSAAAPPLDLVRAEYLARKQAGDTAEIRHFEARFPEQAEKIKSVLAEAKIAEATHETRASSDTQSKRGGSHLPEQFGRYRIIRLLGQGGMGAVYLARDTQLDRDVAIKAPRFDIHDSPKAVERFHREARAVAALSHPNICPVFDVGAIDGIPYMTMAFIEGKPLSAYLATGKTISAFQAVQLTRKIALTLAEAHRRDIIHRDLKPANIMINQRKEPIVMDFGLARRADNSETRLTQLGAVVGTPAYMSPEQVAGEETGPASDVYSLAVILYEMLTGKIPFEGPAMAVLGQILTQAPPKPSQFRADLDLALEQVVLKALAKKPTDRYPSMREFAEALRAVSTPRATVARVVDAKSTAIAEPAVADSMVFANLQSVEFIPVSPASRPAGQPKAAGHRNLRKWRVPAFVAVAFAILATLAAVIVITMRTQEAIVTVKVHDKDLKVSIDGRSVQVDGSEMRMPLGKHTLHVLVNGTPVEIGKTVEVGVDSRRLVVKLGDAELHGNRFELRQGEEVAIEILMEPVTAVVANAPSLKPAKVSPKPIAGPDEQKAPVIAINLEKGLAAVNPPPIPVVPAAPTWVAPDSLSAPSWAFGPPLIGQNNRELVGDVVTVDNGGISYFESDARDAVLRAKVKFGQGQNAGFGLREQPNNGGNYYAYCYRHPKGHGFFNVAVAVPSGFRDLKTVRRDNFPSGFMDLEFSAVGDLLTFKVNGSTVIEVHDGTHVRGKCNVIAYKARAMFKNIEFKILSP